MLRLREVVHAIAREQRIRRDLLIQCQQIRRRQHLMCDDGVQNRLFLAYVKVQRTTRHRHVIAEPPLEQFRRCWRHEVKDFRATGFKADAQRFCSCREGLRQRERARLVTIVHVCRLAACRAHAFARADATAATVLTTSASKPNTSTTRTHTLRVPALAGTVTSACVVTRSGSPSLAVLPR